jgi:glycosyltransferase involved in cell wall biosynthesis
MTATGTVQPWPVVTVLVAAYNAEQFIHRAIESALSQSLPITEVLVVDDASTDGTGTLQNSAPVRRF